MHKYLSLVCSVLQRITNLSSIYHCTHNRYMTVMLRTLTLLSCDSVWHSPGEHTLLLRHKTEKRELLVQASFR